MLRIHFRYFRHISTSGCAKNAYRSPYIAHEARYMDARTL